MTRLFDAHNHLQDERLRVGRSAIVDRALQEGLELMCVNGSSPADWPVVRALADEYRCVIPFFGCHPWHLSGLPETWSVDLRAALSSIPSGIGEIGLDGWKNNVDDELQTEIFLEQLLIAAELKRPAAIHGLRAWGRLYDLIRAAPRLESEFLLHSYGGPKEMISQFAKLGAFFSFPGYFLKPGCEKKLDVFRHVPKDRLLVETDAPDQALPEPLEVVSLGVDDQGRRINHPANIRSVYEGLAAALDVELDTLATQVESNFRALFGALIR